MKKLTNEQIIEICDKVIEKVKEAEIKGVKIYLCDTTATEISKIINKPIIQFYVLDYISQFTNVNARKYANAKSYGVWWQRGDNNYEFNYSDRIKFMDWFKLLYQNK